ncbi:MAG: ABC transporter permease subunit [Coriobacteriia bacterium]|nr:ABC transporter permease subunit [Coriobacteriia bacterium]
MRRRLSRPVGYVIAVLALLLGWELLALALASPALPGPYTALPAFAMLAPDLIGHAGLSLWRVSGAMVIGATLAVPLGLAIGRSELADSMFAPLMFLTYPVPKVVFLPVLLVLFGLGDVSKIVLIATIVFFQILLTARDAARAVPEGAVLSVRSLGAARVDIAQHVIFPAALPDIFTALRISTGTAVAVLFLAESIAGTDGLGWFIMDAWGRIDYPRMFAGILAMALSGVLLYEAIEVAERLSMRWRRAAR